MKPAYLGEHQKVNYAYLGQTVFTKYGSFSRDLRSGSDDLKMRLRLDLNAIEIKKARWGGESVLLPMHLFQSYVIETVEEEKPVSTKK